MSISRFLQRLLGRHGELQKTRDRIDNRDREVKDVVQAAERQTEIARLQTRYIEELRRRDAIHRGGQTK